MQFNSSLELFNHLYNDYSLIRLDFADKQRMFTHFNDTLFSDIHDIKNLHDSLCDNLCKHDLYHAMWEFSHDILTDLYGKLFFPMKTLFSGSQIRLFRSSDQALIQNEAIRLIYDYIIHHYINL